MVSWLTDWFSSMDSETKKKIDVLNEVKLFEFCSKDDLISIADRCEFRSFEAGDRIVTRGDDGDGMYMIDDGSVEVLLDDESEPVGVLEAGDYFGEMSLLDNQPRSAHVDGRQGGRLLYFSEEGFRKMLPNSTETIGKVMYVFARTLSRRLRNTNEQLRELQQEVQG